MMAPAGHEGGCPCGAIRYRLESDPMFVHCCHCTWCQRESGSAFAVNALIEADRVTLLTGTPENIDGPSASGMGHRMVRCPVCKVCVWSHYATLRDHLSFIRVGTLDEPSRCPPDVNIFTSTKLPWVILPDGVPAFTEYYSRREVWPEEALKRHQVLRDAAAG